MYSTLFTRSPCIHDFSSFDVKFQELEAIEENWQSEVKNLLSVVDRLQGENKRLRENSRSEKHAAVAEIAAKRQG